MTARALGGGSSPHSPLFLLFETLKARKSKKSVRTVVRFSLLIAPGIIPQLSEAFLKRLGAVFAQVQFSSRYAGQSCPFGEIYALTTAGQH